MQNAQVCDGIAGSALYFGAQRSLHDNHPAGARNDMAVRDDTSVGKHDTGSERGAIGVWDLGYDSDDAGGYFSVSRIVDCDGWKGQESQQHDKRKTIAHFGYLP
jgi:hypothetical protein